MLRNREELVRRLSGKPLARAVRWYDPGVLVRVGIRDAISAVFGEYADQRLMQAATDPAKDRETLTKRYDCRLEPLKGHVVYPPNECWVDYIADVGDGFGPTYGMATLLAADELSLNGEKLPAGRILILGGDQCYPQATREEYKRKLLLPYNWAFTTSKPDRKLFALPGNHDWYDGLTSFDSLFCAARDKNSRGSMIGGWQCQQHRSYWAIKLPYNWWIWGADIQFSKYLDASQVSYFETVAAQMGPKDNLIVCLAEPSWLLAEATGEDEEENFFKITAIARKQGVRIRAAIAGDWHHYARYFAHELDVHFITSGGGGAFMHPTHVLKNAISVRWPERPDYAEDPAPDSTGVRPGEGWKPKAYDIHLKKNTKVAGSVVEQAVQDVQDALEPLQSPTLSPKRKRQPLKPQAPKCYPAKSKSYLLSLGNILFPFYNPAFAIGIGLIYWLITWEFQTLVTRHEISAGKIDALGITTSLGDVLPFMPLYLLQAMIASISLVVMIAGLYAVLVWYVDAVDYPGPRRYLTKFFVGSAHFGAHLTAMFTLSLFVVMLDTWMTPPIERAVNAIYESRRDQTPIVKDVIEESLKPLQRRTAEQQSAPAQAGEKRQKPIREIVGFMSYPTLMIGLGALLGGSLWGFYWVLTGLNRMHAGESFAALRIQNYKNFLRLKLDRSAKSYWIERTPPGPPPQSMKNQF